MPVLQDLDPQPLLWRGRAGLGAARTRIGDRLIEIEQERRLFRWDLPDEEVKPVPHSRRLLDEK